ncbi:MAG: alkaline phosphatase family protein [Bryobacterales bacterium]|nr:alkaline phosphatase family protein [Bryobacterales bacterium]
MNRILPAILLAAAAVASAQPPSTTTPGPTPAPRPAARTQRPKLVLAIVIDQFRLDYFYRFRDQYTGGLAQLYNQGAFFTNAHYEHFPTVTAIGHSTVLTGATPSISGIVGNEWYDREIKKQVTSVSDDKVTLLGGSGPAASPKKLLVSTVADELKMSGGKSKAIGISMKDRSAILPVGRMADAAYWFDDESGHMVTSTYYMSELPAWVKSFNDSRVTEKWCGQPWTSITDSSAPPLFEIPAGAGKPCMKAIERSPFGNDLVEQFAEAAIANEKLGQNGGTDVLSVSFSANDRVGHDVGPDDPKVKDISIRTDRQLAKLFQFIDQKVGMRNVVVVLTADHGVAPLPELMQQRKMPGGRVPESAALKRVEDRLTELYGTGKWIVGKSGPAPYLNYELIENKKLDAGEVREQAAEVLRHTPYIYRVYTRDQLAAGRTLDDLIDRRVRNGYHAQRAADLFIVIEPYWLFEKGGTSHGTPYNYDSHVPVVLMGPGIKPGRYHHRAAVNDIAPTLATLLEVEVPSGATGRVLEEALR